MAAGEYKDEDDLEPFNPHSSTSDRSHVSSESVTSISSSSIELECLNARGIKTDDGHAAGIEQKDEDYDEEDGLVHPPIIRPMDKRFRKTVWALGGLCLGGWLLALVLFLSRQHYRHSSNIPYDPAATVSRGSGKAVTLDQVLGVQWHPRAHDISWINGPNGEDGLLLEKERGSDRGYLVVEDVRSRKDGVESLDSITLMKKRTFDVGKGDISASRVWPSKDFKKVLIASDVQKNWRHSFTALYWIFDVASQTAEALDPANPAGRVQLALWSPTSDAIVFTRDNNMFLRKIGSGSDYQGWWYRAFLWCARLGLRRGSLRRQ